MVLTPNLLITSMMWHQIIPSLSSCTHNSNFALLRLEQNYL
uniref:Uncharacterized protein n=1 Tax=Arundo donax TaxID=35708 RepID=A0A0A9HAB3_ARUDO